MYIKERWRYGKTAVNKKHTSPNLEFATISPKDIKKVSRLHGFTKSFCQLVLVAQGFKLSSWIASRMGLQALGSSLDECIEDNSNCYKPLSPTEGQDKA